MRACRSGARSSRASPWAIAAAIAEVLGPDAANGYRNGPWGFSDAQQLQDDLSAAGFADVEVSRDEITVVFEDADHLIRTLGAAPVGAKVQALGPEDRRTLRRAVENAASTLIDGDSISGMTTCHTGTGTA